LIEGFRGDIAKIVGQIGEHVEGLTTQAHPRAASVSPSSAPPSAPSSLPVKITV
jgi:hypothetical protein